MDPSHFIHCVTRINLIDARTAEVDVLTFGAKDHDATDGSAEFDAEVPLLN